MSLFIWTFRLMVRPIGFHPINVGSTPSRSDIECFNAVLNGYFYFSCREKYRIYQPFSFFLKHFLWSVRRMAKPPDFLSGNYGFESRTDLTRSPELSTRTVRIVDCS